MLMSILTQLSKNYKTTPKKRKEKTKQKSFTKEVEYEDNYINSGHDLNK